MIKPSHLPEIGGRSDTIRKKPEGENRLDAGLRRSHLKNPVAPVAQASRVARRALCSRVAEVVLLVAQVEVFAPAFVAQA
jgi:hypothetical protein